ncbi:MAG: hypothetical protein J0H15_11315 [Xanthomonadales bacterium]|nr:hypothetical protein [Xanthomonadales bacterium]
MPDALRARYAASLLAKRDEVAAAWQAACAAPADATARATLHTHVHRLCGSATAYGYARLGDLACEAEHRLRGFGVGDAALAGKMEMLLAEIGEAVALAQHVLAARERPAVPQMVLVGAHDAGDESWLPGALRAGGCAIRRADGLDGIWPLLMARECHAVVVDGRLPPATLREMAARLQGESWPGSPLLACFTDEGGPAVTAACVPGCAGVFDGADGVRRFLALLRERHGPIAAG